MSIVGVSGSTETLYQYLQSLNSAGNTGSVTPPAAGIVDSDGDTDGIGTTQSTNATSNTQNTSGGTSGAPSLIQQLETAIQSALNGVNSSQSNDPQTVLSSIEQAVQTTLQNNGITPNQVSQTGHHHHGHHGGGQGGSGAGIQAALGASSSDTSGSGTSSSTTQTPTLDTLLAQLNVDPRQFRNDLISALAGSQNGSIDPSQVFQSFPTGQNVNVLT